tara:strand:+ start:693 stop:1037 length:345 start_codon:yes stop_codon:yes gene_type:complete
MINDIETFTALIYVGLKPGYDGEALESSIAENIIQEYCDTNGLCVTIEPLKFIYTNGREPGLRIGLINYPRFPKTKSYIKDEALKLAALLKEKYKQERVSVVCKDRTYTIGELN